jgi:hypothetical protein
VFPLAGTTFPTTARDLANSIRSELASVLVFRNGSPVVVDAPKYPKVKRLKIDLNGARVTAKEPPPAPMPTGKRQTGIDVDQLQVSGHPIQYETSKVNLELEGKRVRFDFAKDKSGKPLLVLSDAANGKVAVDVTKEDLKSLAIAIAKLATAQQRVTIEDVDVNLTSDGSRQASADVRVKAKKLMVRSIIHVTGHLEFDDELNATISNLTCTGDGAIGSIVSRFIQPKLKEYNGRKIPLVAFSLGDLALRDLNIDVKDGLHVTAGFGK